MSKLVAMVAIGVGIALTGVSGVGWWRARQELQAVASANESLRKTLGDLTLAITEKDREMERRESHCRP